MNTLFFSLVISMGFFFVVVMGWSVVHMLAAKRLGERKLGCKGPVPGENGEMLCCKGDGNRCEDMGQKV
ncbi:MAG: hypothetical protein KAH38_12915 [Candidatus Hydrogenedentes bacterium]|nr:hypothetical protein [Candidatus Hydrogenedentota bacterium]